VLVTCLYRLINKLKIPAKCSLPSNIKVIDEHSSQPILMTYINSIYSDTSFHP